MILATKLFVPRPRADMVPRPRLIDRLNDSLATGRCSLLSAPAGSGKTSLLAAWLAQVGRPAAWLALDENDQVLRYLIAACRQLAPGCGERALARLEAPRPPPPEAVVTDLVNDLIALPTPSVLVLDDYHLVRDPAAHTAVAFLLEHLPPALHLVIAGREDPPPPFPLPRLRARREVVEVRAADLGFRVEEAQALLDALRLPATEVSELVERTEGWAAGLHLAALALRDKPDPAAVVAAFTGGHRLVADYLLAEVLDNQPSSIRRFLLATSVLGRLCAPLCDALLDASDSQDVLEELERSNLFLVPLDDERVWYRFHRLFADAARARLVREAGPEAGPEAVADLHRRAGTWFADAGLLPEAIGHALAAGAVDDAATWIEALAPTMFATMSIHQRLTGWLDALPEAVVRGRPMLCLARAWLLIHRVDLEPAAEWVEAASFAAGSATGAILATRAYLATVSPDTAPDRAVALAEKALADLPPGDTAFRGIAGVSLGQAALALGHLDRAERAFADAAAADKAAGLVQGSLTVTTQQINVMRLRGARREALAIGQAALAWASGLAVSSTVGRLRTVLADLLIDADDLDAALPLALDGLAAPREFGNAPPLVLLASLPVIRLRLARGEVDAAEEVLAEVRPLVRHGPFATVTLLLEAAEARVRPAADASVAWAVATAWDAPVAAAVAADLLRFGAAAVEAAAVTPARVLVTRGRATGDPGLLDRARQHLDAAERLAADHGIGWLRLRVLIQRAVLADALGDRRAALGFLAGATALAEPEGIVRPFLDEGEPMASLRAEPPAQGRAEPPAQGPDPLTEREIDVLRLLAAGRSNAAIAAALFVELSTVKTHLIHVYGKLGVHSRTQAVARARALGLLD